jgi:hypothetical protein
MAFWFYFVRTTGLKTILLRNRKISQPLDDSGREIVDFLDHAMSYHVAEELSVVDKNDDDKAEGKENEEVTMNQCTDSTLPGDSGPNTAEATPVSMEARLVRAFLMADINSRLAGLMTSGATVAICLLKVSFRLPETSFFELG